MGGVVSRSMTGCFGARWPLTPIYRSTPCTLVCRRPQFLVVGGARGQHALFSLPLEWIIHRPSVHSQWCSSGCLHLLTCRVIAAAGQTIFVPHGIGGAALFWGHAFRHVCSICLGDHKMIAVHLGVSSRAVGITPSCRS